MQDLSKKAFVICCINSNILQANASATSIPIVPPVPVATPVAPVIAIAIGTATPFSTLGRVSWVIAAWAVAPGTPTAIPLEAVVVVVVPALSSRRPVASSLAIVPGLLVCTFVHVWLRCVAVDDKVVDY
jgi:hypothetical protein